MTPPFALAEPLQSTSVTVTSVTVTLDLTRHRGRFDDVACETTSLDLVERGFAHSERCFENRRRW